MTPATEYMLNTSLTLAGIMLVAWLVVYATRRWERAAPRGPLELLGTLRLEGKRAVYLVRIGERVVALGATEGGMIKVMEVPASQTETAPARSIDGFGALLNRLKQQPRVNAPSHDATPVATVGDVVSTHPPAPATPSAGTAEGDATAESPLTGAPTPAQRDASR